MLLFSFRLRGLFTDLRKTLEMLISEVLPSKFCKKKKQDELIMSLLSRVMFRRRSSTKRAIMQISLRYRIFFLFIIMVCLSALLEMIIDSQMEHERLLQKGLWGTSTYPNFQNKTYLPPFSPDRNRIIVLKLKKIASLRSAQDKNFDLKLV